MWQITGTCPVVLIEILCLRNKLELTFQYLIEEKKFRFPKWLVMLIKCTPANNFPLLGFLLVPPPPRRFNFLGINHNLLFQFWSDLVEQFCRQGVKLEKVNNNGWTPSDTESPLGLWSGQLIIKKLKHLKIYTYWYQKAVLFLFSCNDEAYPNSV